MGRSQGCSGGGLEGPLESFIFVLLDVNLSIVLRNMFVFSLGSFCEAVDCFLIMVSFYIYSVKLFLLRNRYVNML